MLVLYNGYVSSIMEINDSWGNEEIDIEVLVERKHTDDFVYPSFLKGIFNLKNEDAQTLRETGSVKATILFRGGSYKTGLKSAFEHFFELDEPYTFEAKDVVFDDGIGDVPNNDEYAKYLQYTEREARELGFKKVAALSIPKSSKAANNPPDIKIDSETTKPWEIPDPRDLKPKQDWYISARYFARQLVEDDSTLLVKRDRLCEK